MEKEKEKRSGQLEKKRKKEKRSKTVMVRFTEEEYNHIKEDSEKVNLKIAEYCRMLTLMGQVKVIQSKKFELDHDTLTVLYQIGSNLNQLLKHLNQTKAQYLTYEEVLDAILLIDQLKEIYRKILEGLQ